MQAGSTEVLLDDTRRVADKARAAGVEVELHIWPKMPHVWPIFAPFLPESRRALDDAARFVRRVTRAQAAQASETSMV
jgi:acetyl esterase/lipase